MSKFIKVFYNVGGPPDEECLNKCPFGSDCMCGSIVCKENCKYCFGTGSTFAFYLLDHRDSQNEFFMGHNWIYCGKTYNHKRDWYFRRLLYVTKINTLKLYRKFLVLIGLRRKWEI